MQQGGEQGSRAAFIDLASLSLSCCSFHSRCKSLVDVVLAVTLCFSFHRGDITDVTKNLAGCDVLACGVGQTACRYFCWVRVNGNDGRVRIAIDKGAVRTAVSKDKLANVA